MLLLELLAKLIILIGFLTIFLIKLELITNYLINCFVYWAGPLDNSAFVASPVINSNSTKI